MGGSEVWIGVEAVVENVVILYAAERCFARGLEAPDFFCCFPFGAFLREAGLPRGVSCWLLASESSLSFRFCLGFAFFFFSCGTFFFFDEALGWLAPPRSFGLDRFTVWRSCWSSVRKDLVFESI